jgi:Dyp-type peroxidase family
MFQLTQEARTDIQGIITSGYGHLPDAQFLFLEINDAKQGRAWLNEVIPSVTTAGPWPKTPNGRKIKPRTALNIAFTIEGFKAMGLSDTTRWSFAREFIMGMADRAQVLGDAGDSAPENWEIGGPRSSMHAVLMLYAEDEPTCRRWYNEHRARIHHTGGGVRELTIEYGHRFSPPHEHFGFQDGISQPEIEGVKRKPDPGQTLVSTGEFILGYPNAYGCLPPTIGVPREEDVNNLLPPFPERREMKDFGRHGTYLVYRKMAQHVAAFWQFMEKTIEGASLSPQEREHAVTMLASRFVGRWRSGAPLVLAPTADDPQLGEDNARNNDFSYMPTDPQGFACPFGAHLRRTNPRDSLARDSPEESLRTSNRHRIVRRGMPYGDQLVKDTVIGIEDDGKPRGIQFFVINTNIKRQFEFTQQQWVNNPKFNGLFNDRDPIIGNNDGTGNMTLQTAFGRRSIPKVPSFITVRGGGYFFLPSVTALHFLGFSDR